MKIDQKLEQLKNHLEQYPSLAVAFSGGVDSAFLLKVAKEEKGDQVTAFTVITPSTLRNEIEEAIEFTRVHEIKHEIIQINNLEDPQVQNNHQERCYFCKKLIFKTIQEKSKELDIHHIADGTNLDDLDQYRPGKKALEELEVLSPLAQNDFTKKDIRFLSRRLRLKTWKAPSQSCLLTRFQYGTKISETMLRKAETAEDILRNNGFTQNRVRVFDQKTVIEVAPEELEKLIDTELKTKITTKIENLGFPNVEFDPQGYRTGRMDEGQNK